LPRAEAPPIATTPRMEATARAFLLAVTRFIFRYISVR
jgi:hypothetical protein